MYAALPDLIARAGEAEIRQTADRDRDGVVDTDVVTAALTDADNLINGYLRTRYSLPLATVPSLVKTWATSIARYVLHRNGAPDYVERDYKDALAALKDVSAGRLIPPDMVGNEPAAKTGGSYLSDVPPPHFSDPRGFRC
jgi:phage gp36-like protein